jgi:hypothetical protein
MVEDRSALEVHDHPPGPKRGRRQLHGIQVDDLDALTGDRGIAEVDDRDRGLVEADAPLQQLWLHLLRNSDRPLA